MKQTGMLVVSLRGENFGFCSRLGCYGQSANILSRQGLVQGQGYAKRNRSQIFFFTCFVYRITSVIINQRFLQIVENIIIRLISDNKGSVITRCLCALSIVCLQQETQRVQRLQNYKTIMLKISVSWFPGAGQPAQQAFPREVRLESWDKSKKNE